MAKKKKKSQRSQKNIKTRWAKSESEMESLQFGHVRRRPVADLEICELYCINSRRKNAAEKALRETRYIFQYHLLAIICDS